MWLAGKPKLGQLKFAWSILDIEAYFVLIQEIKP